MCLHRILLIALLAPVALGACTTTAPMRTVEPGVRTSNAGATSTWRDDVVAISDAGDNDARREAIVVRLGAIGLAPRAERFDRGGKRGQNILADVGGDAASPVLLIGAHYDKVRAGRGATDNASGSATVLALAQRLQARSLRHHRVAVAFWDLEEAGLLGSRAHVGTGGERPALYVNFDVFGWGDTLWMMAKDASDPLAVASRTASTQAGIGFSAAEEYPPTDHRAFLEAGWAAVSYSLVGREEIASILAMYAGKEPADPPKVMQVIHTDRDTIDEIDAAAVAKGIDAVEAALRAWDAEAPASR